VSADWYSPSYSPPDHAYTPTGDASVVVDDYYASDDDYTFSGDDYDWPPRYDNTDERRPRGTGRKLPAPPPTAPAPAATGWPAVNGGASDAQQARAPPLPLPAEPAAPPTMNGYAVLLTAG